MEEENKARVCSFFLEGKCRFNDRCRNYHPSNDLTDGPECAETTVLPMETSSQDMCLQSAASAIEKDDVSGRKAKKPPMKTASDVISRITWDASLPAEHFVIGYLDRFLGVVEQPFLVFDWSDLSSADHEALAIPKHRIQYFKYKGGIVWDKRQRVDSIFGSTGATDSIAQIMEKIDSQVEERNADNN